MDTREQIVALHLKGMTYGQIKYHTGLSRGTIGGHLSRWRIANGYTADRVNGRVWTASEDDDLRRMYFAGAPKDTMAKALGRSVRAIDDRVNALRQTDTLAPRKVDDECMASKAHVREMRECDARFMMALAAAFRRGDHLPAMARAA